MTNNDSDDYPEVPEGLVEDIQDAVEGRTLSPDELQELFRGIRDDDDAVWIVERPITTFSSDQIAVYDDRVDAIDHALRLAKQESEETGEPYDAGVAHERDLLIGTEQVFEHFVCGRKRWRVVQGVSDSGEKSYPEDVENTTLGMPDGDKELDYDDGDAEEWKEPYPDDIDDYDTGCPEGDEEIPYNENADPDGHKEPYPDDINGK